MNIKWVEWQKKKKHKACGNIRKNVLQSRIMDDNDLKRTRKAERVTWWKTKKKCHEKKKISSFKYKRESMHYKSKKYLLNLITRSLVISVRAAFVEHCGRKTGCLDLRSNKEMSEQTGIILWSLAVKEDGIVFREEFLRRKRQVLIYVSRERISRERTIIFF